MKKTKVATLITSILLLVILVMTVSGCSYSKRKELPPVSDENGKELELGKIHQIPNELKFSSTTLASSPGGVAVTLKATVFPENAGNKRVDWSARWENESNAEDINTYLTIIPTESGSQTATVTCLKAFSEKIFIDVITRDGNYKATCTVLFVGKPTSIGIDFDASLLTYDRLGDYSRLSNYTTYEFPLKLTNVFDQVNAEASYTFTVEAIGSIKVADMVHNFKTNAKTYNESTLKTVSIASITKHPEFDTSFYEINTNNNKLTIKINTGLEMYYLSSSRTTQQQSYKEHFHSYVDYSCYKITITESNYNLKTTFRFRTVNGVTAVSLDNSSLEF